MLRCLCLRPCFQAWAEKNGNNSVATPLQGGTPFLVSRFCLVVLFCDFAFVAPPFRAAALDFVVLFCGLLLVAQRRPSGRHKGIKRMTTRVAALALAGLMFL